MTVSICSRMRSGSAEGKIDLVDDGDDFEVVVEREVGVGEGSALDALAGVDDQERAFARLKAAGDFVREIDVAGGGP